MNGGFQRFWEAFPRKVGKFVALKEWEKAIRLDTEANILAGVERYKRSKPEYADWCHPRTFLSQGRWMDEDDEAPVVVAPRRHWAEECAELHGGTCDRQWNHEMRKRESA